MQVLGIILIIIGCIIIYFIGRRKFYRRTITGSEQFKSYERSLVTPLIERLLRTIGILLVLVGIFFWFVGWGNKKFEEKHRRDAIEKKIK
jgi:hypothetical protein